MRGVVFESSLWNANLPICFNARLLIPYLVIGET